MNIADKQETAKKEFQRMINDLIDAGYTPLTIARELSGGDEEFVRTYRPAIAQKLRNGLTLPNWVIGEEIRKLYERVTMGTQYSDK